MPIPLVRDGNAGVSRPSEAPRRSSTGASAATSAAPSPCCAPTWPPSRNTHRSIATATACCSSRRSSASTPGKFDGLYWPADASRGEPLSPFGPLIAESSAYLAGHKRGDPYRGYHFRILTRQGKSAPGGAYSYVINGRMVAGFGDGRLPGEYGESGVMTFIVNSAGKIFEKNLGKNTAAIAAKMTTFDPGPGWKEAAP